MEKYLIIDSRMRQVEKKFLESLNYKLIELQKSDSVYPEISSHVDIFVCKIDDILIVEKSCYEYLKNKIQDKQIICGQNFVSEKYPEDVKYNVCQIGSNIVHNFNYTDKKILEIIESSNLNKIPIAQGYSNCSIAVIDKNAVIVSDAKIAGILRKSNIDVLCLDYLPDIKLLDSSGNYSKMNGFIGGALTRLEDKIVIFGDLQKIDKENKIREFIEKHNLEIIDFKGLDVIDYGGIIEFSATTK